MNPEDIVYLPAGSSALLNLLEAVSYADAKGKPLRIYAKDGNVKYKVGEGMWSPDYWIYNETNRPW